MAELGKVDVLVSNATFQMTHETLEEVSNDEWDHTVAANFSAMFHLCKAVLSHRGPGSSIIGSSSVSSEMPNPTLAPYAATKAAIATFCASLAQLLWSRGIRLRHGTRRRRPAGRARPVL
ncbi:MAG: SDR family NAD(P)-dependent oxidoreductase [Acidimicrobiales bacterium]